MPLPEDEGATLAPGQQATVAVRMVHASFQSLFFVMNLQREVVRLPEPYPSKCREGHLPQLNAYHSEQIKTNYSAVVRSCLNEPIMEFCHRHASRLAANVRAWSVAVVVIRTRQSSRGHTMTFSAIGL